VTITVTADVAFVPPRNEVEVSVPTGNVMTSVNVWRNDSSGRSLVRSQPSAGFDERTVFDYECPYGQNVTYDWAATYYDPDDSAPTFSEPWSSYPGSWAGNTGDGSISANRLTFTPANPSGRAISRTISAACGEIEVAYLDGGGFGLSTSTSSLLFQFASGQLNLFESAGSVYVTNLFSGFNTGVPANEPFTIQRLADTVVFVGASSSYTLSRTLTGNVTSIAIGASVNADLPIVVGAITISEVAPGDVETIAETSAPVNLNPADAWMIAPQSPALSIPLSNSNQQAAGIRTIGPLSNATNTTVHRILGTSTPITTTTGNRQDDTLSATLYTHTSNERQALKALLAPDTPVLVNVPPSWDLDLAYGFYQVGDVTETRPYTLGGVPMRDFELPLTRVRSPEVDVENPGWSYAQVATVWATYTEVLTNYATYADLAADNRS
jgi:hypothetical protein